jgi:hypothetical protein
VRGLSVHGSATAVRWAIGVNLALLHTKDDIGRYVSVLYTFSARPPFAVLAVSRPLPLHLRSFASGLAVPPGSDKVVITYGWDDEEGRALVLSRSYVRELFEWCTPELAAALAVRLASREVDTPDVDNDGAVINGTQTEGQSRTWRGQHSSRLSGWPWLVTFSASVATLSILITI